jgi:phospholipid/cholesterol/gamma-HCH transport system substrate-binding protein
MTLEIKEQMIGGLTFVVLLAVIGFMNQTSDVTGAAEGRIRVEALFGRVDGINPGAEVRLGGIRIGSVTAQRLDDRYRAVLTLSLTDDVPVPKDSSASVQTDGLFGGKFIVIEPGGSMEGLRTGDLIGYTQDSQVVSDILDLIISQGRQALEGRKAGAGADAGSGPGFGPADTSGSAGPAGIFK